MSTFTIGFLAGFAVAGLVAAFALLLAYKRGLLAERWEKVAKRLQEVIDLKSVTIEEQRDQIETLQDTAGMLITDRMKPSSDARH